MWTLIFIISMNMVQTSNTEMTMTNIPGFSSKETCQEQAKLMMNNLSQELPVRVKYNYHCVNVK